MLARVVVPPADRRTASAVRRFPPGCGHARNAATEKAPRPLPLSSTKPPFPNPSARAAAKTAAPPPRRTVPAAEAASSGTERTDCGVGNGRKAAAEVIARGVSAVRRYPPGCGRGAAVAVSKPPALAGQVEVEATASKPPAAECVEAKAKACDREAARCACAIGHGDFNSGGGVKNGGGGDDAGAEEEGCGKPWVVPGLMAAPVFPWAQYGGGRSF